MRLIILLLAIILFPLSYGICEYFYADEIVKWDYLRHDLYAVNILLAASFYIFKYNSRHEKIIYLLSYIFVSGMVVPSIIDKRFFNDRSFHASIDLPFIALSIILGFEKYFPKLYKKGKLKIKNAVALIIKPIILPIYYTSVFIWAVILNGAKWVSCIVVGKAFRFFKRPK